MPDTRSMLPLYARAVLPVKGTRAAQPPSGVLQHEGVRVDPGALRGYCGVVGAGHGTTLPLLYPHLLGFDLQMQMLTSPTFPVPALGLVHLTNVVTTTRAIDHRAVLDVSVHATPLRPHPKGRTVDFVTQVSEDGELVWTETSTYLRREKVDPEVAASVLGAATPLEVPADVELHASAQWRLAGDLGRRYASVSGDVNPIHLYSLTAKAFGFNRQIVHGMWTAAAVAGALENRLPEAVVYSVEFLRPLSLPGTVWLWTGLGKDGAAAEVRSKDKVALRALAVPA